ncbi:MFS family permease [Kutzneria viridogrisea]|uniref:MFS family permease n=1 Tax=Kutzneria viridogrisea TaxID=47990 RepID=A0ABR6BM95_9PSEU|nr:MFS transporter [Kutzneria albida]MBA8927771.1 MFS family permease [Kutzneria viridogrisea]
MTADPPPVRHGIRTPAFRRLLRVWFIALVGDGIRVTALPVFAAISTRDPLAVSAVAVAEVLPWLLVSLPAGALVDRMRPRTVVLCAHSARALLTAALAGLVLVNQAGVLVLVVFAFLVTSAQTFADSAEQLLLVELAGPEDLDRANGWFVTAETIGLDLAGPLAAGLVLAAEPAGDGLVLAWPPALCFALNALAFLVAAVEVARLPDVVPERGEPAPGDQRSALVRLRADLLEGGRFLLRSRGLRALVGTVMITAFAVSAANAVTALYVVQTLGAPAAVMSAMLIALSLGTLLAARVSPLLAGKVGDGPVMIGSLVLLGAGMVLVGAVPSVATAVLGYLVVGCAVGGWNVLAASRRQRLTPSRMMGRVSSTYRVLTWGFMPLGAGLAGPLAVQTSLRAVFLVVGVLIAAAALLAARALLRVPEPAV